jgi:putative nucleotidyltransferase with HDIG domain
MMAALAVLIVEDSESDALLIVRALKKAGYDVVSERVENAAQMRSALGMRPWNIVISDYNLPQFDGRAALTLLQETRQDIPFIVVSGAIGEESAVAIMKAGAHDYVLKGNLARLTPAVERELAQAEIRRERMDSARALQRRGDEFAALFETAAALTLEQELHTLLEIIVERARGLLGAPGGAILLYESARHELAAVVAQQVRITVGTRVKFGEGMAGRVAESRQPLIIDDYQAWAAPSPADDSLAAAVAMPMLYGGELIGVLIIVELTPNPRKFTLADAHLLSLFAGQAASVVHDARLLEETQRQLSYLRALRNIDTAITGSFDLNLTLKILLAEASAQLKVDAVDVLLLNPHSRLLEFKAGLGFRTTALQHTRLRLGEGYAGRAALEVRTIRVPDLRHSPGELSRSPQLGSEDFASYFAAPLALQDETGRSSEDFMAYYAAPLKAKGRVSGVLEIFNRSPLNPDLHWLDFLETLAGQTAIAIESSIIFNDLQRSNVQLAQAYDSTLEGWSRALDLRDKETEGHTVRTTETTLLLARAIGLEDEALVHVRRGALLHDIGKMGVPDSILLKPGPLTDDEWVMMKKHPTLAYEMLVPIAYLRPALDIPYCHHEKWDGTGYPRGLKGEQIPLTARIFAVVDVWDALRSDRPYRAAWPEEKVRWHIRALSGTHFDPHVVKVFLKLVE